MNLTNRYLRYYLLEAATSVRRCDSEFRRYNIRANEERNKGAFVMDAESMDIDRLLSRSQSLALSKGKGGDK